MKNATIIRYCEIHLKGKNRSYFEKLLKDNIKHALKDIPCKFTPLHSRYVIEDFDESFYTVIAEKLKKIAGIHTFSKAIVTDNDENQIVEASLSLCENKTGTFKVEVNRADKTFEIHSMDFVVNVLNVYIKYVL